MNMIENWYNTKYEHYQVSNLGNARSVDHYCNSKGGSVRFCKGKPLTKKYDKTSGYYRISVRGNGKQRWVLLHRLIAETLIPNPTNLPQVNHKDENKLNNTVDNLEWCSASYNVNYGNRNKKCSEWQKQNNRVRKALLQYTLDGQFVAEYPSIAEASRQTGIFNHPIIRCCKGKSHTAGGYIWKYKT